MPRDAESAIRKRLRSGKVEPTRSGVLVTGRFGKYKGPRERCHDHLWFTRRPEKNPLWQSGYAQGALCVVCGDEIDPIDSSWWLDVASKSDINKAIALCKKRRRWLDHSIKKLEEWWTDE